MPIKRTAVGNVYRINSNPVRYGQCVATKCAPLTHDVLAVFEDKGLTRPIAVICTHISLLLKSGANDSEVASFIDKRPVCIDLHGTVFRTHALGCHVVPAVTAEQKAMSKFCETRQTWVYPASMVGAPPKNSSWENWKVVNTWSFQQQDFTTRFIEHTQNLVAFKGSVHMPLSLLEAVENPGREAKYLDDFSGFKTKTYSLEQLRRMLV